jgi:hypothetical protein
MKIGNTILPKCSKVQILGYDSNKSNLHLVQNLLFSHLMSKNVNIEMHNNYNIPGFVWLWNLPSYLKTTQPIGLLRVCLKTGCWEQHLEPKREELIGGCRKLHQ